MSDKSGIYGICNETGRLRKALRDGTECNICQKAIVEGDKFGIISSPVMPEHYTTEDERGPITHAFFCETCSNEIFNRVNNRLQVVSGERSVYYKFDEK